MPRGSRAAQQGSSEDSGADPPAGRKGNKGRAKGRKGRRTGGSSSSGEEDDVGQITDCCTSCGQHVHAHAKGCPVARKQQTAKCFLCGARGHLRSECPNPPGGPRGGKGRAERGQKGRSQQAEQADTGGAAREMLAALAHPYLDPCCRLHACQARAGLFGPAGELFDACRVPPECEGVVALFSDGAAFDTASPRYRCWEALLDDARVWGAFGCDPREAAHLADAVERLEEWIAACAPGKVGQATNHCVAIRY